MRKKTINLIVGISIGLIIALISSFAVYYNFGIIKLEEVKTQYKTLLKEYENPASFKAYRLERDIEMDGIIKDSDISEIKLPQVLEANSIISNLEDVVGKQALSKLSKGAIIHSEMLYSQSEVKNDLRIFELGGLVMPYQLKPGNYVDVRISFNSGLDFLALSKKKVQDIIQVGEGGDFREYCVFHLDTDEILRLKSAIVDAYINDGSYLYTTIYVMPDKQKAAEVTYPVNKYVKEMIESDPNIVNKAILALDENKRSILNESLSQAPQNINYSSEIKNRSYIKNEVIKAPESSGANGTDSATGANTGTNKDEQQKDSQKKRLGD